MSSQSKSRALARTMMGIPRNKIIMGGIEAEDAGHFSAAFGEAWRLDRSYTNRDQKVDSRTERETLGARIDYTQIIELEPNQLAVRLIRNRRIEPVYIVESRLAGWVDPAYRQRIIRESHQAQVGEEPVAVHLAFSPPQRRPDPLPRRRRAAGNPRAPGRLRPPVRGRRTEPSG